jgi:hypothetical protein
MKRAPDFALSEAPLELGSAELSNSEPVSGVHLSAVKQAVESIMVDLSQADRSKVSTDGLCQNDQFFIKWPMKMGSIMLQAGSTVTLVDDPLEVTMDNPGKLRGHLMIHTDDGQEILANRSKLAALTRITGQNDNEFFTRRSI